MKIAIMKYILSAFCIAATLSATCQQVFHDANAQVRKLGSFSIIEVSSAIELQLSQGDEDAVAVSSGKENADAIKTEVKNGRLKIWYDQKNWLRINSRARVYVSARSLAGIVADGASEVVINGELSSNVFSIKMSGASDLVGKIKTESLQIELSGASDANLKGSATNLKVDASGASHLKGYDLIADNCLVDASGASDIKLTVSKVINVEASGASNVYYKGTGQEGKIKSTGASSVSRKG
jgi:hypothetical protein